MSRPTRPPRPGSLTGGVLVHAALAVVLPAAALLATSVPARGQEPLVTPGAARTEIRFPAPVRHAIVRQGPGGVRILVARGDTLFDPQVPGQSLTVVRVEAGAIILREGPRGRVQSLKSGRPIPGFPGLTFTDTVLLDQLHYRYKVVDRILHPDPVVVALEGSRAVLEVEVLRSPARATLDGELLAKVRIQEISPGLYEVNAADVQAVLDNAGQVLTDLWPAVQPSLSLQTGLQYRITSAMSDGVLTGQGFTVTAPKLAERAGLQVGDTILSVNGQPVNGFASLYGIIREVRGNPALSTVQVELDRRGTRLTKIFRIR